MVCYAELTTNTLTSPSLPVLTCKNEEENCFLWDKVSSVLTSARFFWPPCSAQQGPGAQLCCTHAEQGLNHGQVRPSAWRWGQSEEHPAAWIRQHGHTNNGVQGEGWQVCHRGLPSIPGGDGACQHPCVRMLMRQHGPPMWGRLGILLSLARSHRAAPAEALSTPPLLPPLGMCRRLLSKGELAPALPATDKWLLWTLVI